VPTKTVIVRDAVAEPSLTVTGIIAVLTVEADVAVIVTVRLAPLPPNVMLLFGTTLMFDELPLSISVLTPLTSATVRFIVPPELIHIPPDATAIVGGALVGVAVGVFVGVCVAVGVVVGVLVGVAVLVGVDV